MAGKAILRSSWGCTDELAEESLHCAPLSAKVCSARKRNRKEVDRGRGMRLQTIAFPYPTTQRCIQ